MFQRLQLKKHALTAISYMLPIVVTAGLLIAIGNLTGGTVITDYQVTYTVPDALVSLGVLGMGLLAPVISAAIAYSIADRPGIGPGLFMGLIANAIGAGFLGGMLGGYLVGFFVLFLSEACKGTSLGTRIDADDDRPTRFYADRRTPFVLCGGYSDCLGNRSTYWIFT